MAGLSDFVPVATSDVEYRNATDRSRLEVQAVDRAFAEAGRPIGQGILIMTASGRYLGGSTGMYELTGPQFARTAMRNALAAYGRLSKAERLLPRTPDAARDRLDWEVDDFRRPEGGLDLRVVGRCLPFDGMQDLDTRHPKYFKIDRLWFTSEEWRALLPASLARGGRRTVTGAAVDRLAQLHIGTMVQPNPAWRPNEVLESAFTSEVESVAGDRVRLAFEGRFRMQGASENNRRAFEGNLIGHAVFDRSDDRFVELEWLCLGTHTLPEGDTHGNAGSRTAPLGILVTLNEDGPNDRLRPTYWRWGYPREWRTGR